MTAAPTEQAEAAREARDKILAAFSTLARRSGIRAVVMGELAARLRISSVALYKHFRSKDELVSAMVEEWALDGAAIDALDREKFDNPTSLLDGSESPLEVLRGWADLWSTSITEASPAFFKDLQRDYPEAWERFCNLIEERKAAAIVYLAPLLREDVHTSAVLRILGKMVDLTADPLFAEEFGISRQEAMRTALLIWEGGALRRGRQASTPGAARKRARQGLRAKS